MINDSDLLDLIIHDVLALPVEVLVRIARDIALYEDGASTRYLIRGVAQHLERTGYIPSGESEAAADAPPWGRDDQLNYEP